MVLGQKESFDSSMHQLWERFNAVVFAWIMSSFSKDLMSMVLYSTSSDLREKLNKVNDSKVFQLHRKICLVQQGVDIISAYFTRLGML